MENRKLIRLLLPVVTGIILAIAAALNFNSGVLASQDHDECGESSGWNHSSHYQDDDDCDDDDEDEEEDEDDRDDDNDGNDEDAEDDDEHEDEDEEHGDEDENEEDNHDNHDEDDGEDEDETSDDNDESEEENGGSNGGTSQDQGQSQNQKQKTEVNVNVEQKQENNQTVNVTGQVAGVSTVPTVQPETGAGVLGMATIAGAGPLGLLLARYGRGRIVGKKEEDLTSIASHIVAERLDKKSS